MLKKLLMLCVAFALSLSATFAAAVEVNTADTAALESVKGIGPVHAKAIIDERTKNGPFKDADDLAARVKGLGTKSVANLEAAGLTINGSTAAPTGAKASTPATTKSGSASSKAKTSTETAAPAATPASAPAEASGTNKSKKTKEAAASAPALTAAASAPAGASDTKASKKKAKKAKAASAASGA